MRTKSNKLLDKDTIKYIAMITMLINHIAIIFLESGTFVCEVLLAIGYFTAITMIYFLVEGYSYTRSKRKYFFRLLLFALLSQIPYCLAFTENAVINFCGLNMFFTLCICFGLIWGEENIRDDTVKFFWNCGLLLLSVVCDWAMLGPVFTLLFLWAGNSEERTKTVFLISALLFGGTSFMDRVGECSILTNAWFTLLDMAGIGLAGVTLMFLYNGKRAEKGRNFSKWFFYVFYPVHLLILGVIRIFCI